MTTKEKIRKLNAYLDKCRRDSVSATNPHKKAFFDREITRTTQTVLKLMA